MRHRISVEGLRREHYLIGLMSRRRAVRSSEAAAFLASVFPVIATVLSAIPAAANTARHDRGGSGHRRGARDRPAAEDACSADSTST